MTVAVGFSPRCSEARGCVAERRLKTGHLGSADLPLNSPFSGHFVAHFVRIESVRVKCSLTKNYRRRISAMVAGF